MNEKRARPQGDKVGEPVPSEGGPRGNVERDDDPRRFETPPPQPRVDKK